MAWTAPYTFSAGELFTAAMGNTYISGNDAALYAGATGIASLVQYDLIQASGANQLARIAGAALGVLGTDSSKVPAIKTATAGQSWRANAAGTDVEAYTPTASAMTLLHEASGTVSAADTNPGDLTSVAISGLTAKDRLLFVMQSAAAFNSGDPIVQNCNPYNLTDGVAFTALGNFNYNVNYDYEIVLAQSPSAATHVCVGAVATGGLTGVTVTTAWTGSWTFSVHYTAITRTSGSMPWHVWLYKLAGQ